MLTLEQSASLFRQMRVRLFSPQSTCVIPRFCRVRNGGWIGLPMFLVILSIFIIIPAIASNYAFTVQAFARDHDEIDGRILRIEPQLCEEMKAHGALTGRGPLTCQRLRLVNF